MKMSTLLCNTHRFRLYPSGGFGDSLVKYRSRARLVASRGGHLKGMQAPSRPET